MHATVVTTDLDASVAAGNATYKVHDRQKAFYSDEVLVLVAMLQVLSGNLHFIEPDEAEATQMRHLIQVESRRSAVETFGKLVTPLAKLLHVLTHGRLLRDEVLLERLADVMRQDRFGEASDVRLRLRWKLAVGGEGVR